MSPERIAALLIGVFAIGLGGLLWPYAKKWQSGRELPLISIVRPRFRVLWFPILFVVLGALLVVSAFAGYR